MAEGVLEVSCQCPTAYEATYTPGSEKSPSMAVLDAIARTAGVDVNDLPPLYEAMDPSAIDRIFSDGVDDEAILAFPYENWNVFVYGNGTINICDQQQSSR